MYYGVDDPALSLLASVAAITVEEIAGIALQLQTRTGLGDRTAVLIATLAKRHGVNLGKHRHIGNGMAEANAKLHQARRQYGINRQGATEEGDE